MAQTSRTPPSGSKGDERLSGATDAGALGDTHNFGRRVTRRGDAIHKPRTVAWERLLLSPTSPLRRTLARIDDDALGSSPFAFLPSLAVRPSRDGRSGTVERLDLRPLPRLSADARLDLARLVGRAVALFTFLGLSDLHWENLALGIDRLGRTVFGPLDVELILDDLALPTETKLLPEADPDIAEVCRHAAGIRRVLPYLGKPVPGHLLVAMVASYRRALLVLDREASALSSAISGFSGVSSVPIRVCLRGTDAYVKARREPVWPPLLDAESEQLARGDIPYFFRFHGRSEIRYFIDPELRESRALPTRGDVPRLSPLLSFARDLASPNRAKLRDEGSFALVGALDHVALSGHVRADGVDVAFGARRLVMTFPDGEEFVAKRNLREFVESAYLPCTCGEVRTPLVPGRTRCRPRPGALNTDAHRPA
ncbi:MAG: hypothetical protein FJ096_18855 [Deltaproteobacteria bacterium]|nr:hypothetical protein [Deltaproteobacteria bacterium]